MASWESSKFDSKPITIWRYCSGSDELPASVGVRRSVTTSNACRQYDWMSVYLVVAENKLDEVELTPIAYLNGWEVTCYHPAMIGIGPMPAVSKMMGTIGMRPGEENIIKLNEVFAA